MANWMASGPANAASRCLSSTQKPMPSQSPLRPFLQPQFGKNDKAENIISEALLPPITWSITAGSPSVAGTNYFLNIPVTNTVRFFLLVHQAVHTQSPRAREQVSFMPARRPDG